MLRGRQAIAGGPQRRNRGCNRTLDGPSPQRGDQHLVAARVAELGAGIRVLPHEARLRGAVSTVLGDPSYRANAAGLGEAFKSSGGYVWAADEVLVRDV
jgi:UDP:flavonoid glycosyltransferase YjiC (YdhE family)